MKKIEAIIREEKLDAIKNALEEKSYFGIPDNSIYSCRNIIIEYYQL